MRKWYLRFNDGTFKIVECKDWKNDYVKESLKGKKIICVYPYKETLPQGWKRIIGTLTQPRGYYFANNGKSRFKKGYDWALIKEEENA